MPRRAPVYLIACFLVGLILFPGGLIARASPPVSRIELQIGSPVALVDGREIRLPVAPVERNGVALVPLRFIGENLGFSIHYISAAEPIRVEGYGRTIEIRVGRGAARVDGREVKLASPPSWYQDHIVVPIRFFSETVGLEVGFDRGTIVISRTNLPPVAKLVLERDTIYVGDALSVKDMSFDPDGDEIVERQWENGPPWMVPGVYEPRFRVKDSRGAWSEPVTLRVKVAPLPGRPPVARFWVDKAVVAQGETVSYMDGSYDPDGDAIINYQWEGRQRAFFEPGEKVIRLRVQDQWGLWSEPYEVRITVTSEVLMDELDYNISHPLPGATFTFPLNVLGLPQAEIRTEDSGPVLLLSNSPEKIPREGVLYRDKASGWVRLYYHHVNGTGSAGRVYAVALNRGTVPVKVEVFREGLAGPSEDEFEVGRRALQRYLDSSTRRVVSVPPGQMVVINHRADRTAKPGETVHGIIDLHADGELEFAYIFVCGEGSARSLSSVYSRLEVLPPDVHSRGTFASSDRLMYIALTDRPCRVILADGSVDVYHEGIDAITGQASINKGNYGVLYKIIIPEGREMAVFTSPRGGGFSGVFSAHGKAYLAPQEGFLAPGKKVIMNGVFDPQGGELLFMPPSASYLPINLILFPVK